MTLVGLLKTLIIMNIDDNWWIWMNYYYLIVYSSSRKFQSIYFEFSSIYFLYFLYFWYEFNLFHFSAYNPGDYDNLAVSAEIKELFQYITRFDYHCKTRDFCAFFILRISWPRKPPKIIFARKSEWWLCNVKHISTALPYSGAITEVLVQFLSYCLPSNTRTFSIVSWMIQTIGTVWCWPVKSSTRLARKCWNFVDQIELLLSWGWSNQISVYCTKKKSMQ